MAVVVGYVPTAPGFAALDQAILEAGWRSVPLILVNVAVGNDFADVTYADDQALDAVRTRLADAGLTFEVRQVNATSDVAFEILAIADEVSADLIVVGLHRRSSVGKMLMGSNAQRIILSAVCPVLSVRPIAE